MNIVLVNVSLSVAWSPQQYICPIELVHLFKVLFLSSQVNLIYIVFDCFKSAPQWKVTESLMDVFLFSLHTIFSVVGLCTHADFFGHCFKFQCFSVPHHMSNKQRSFNAFYIVMPVGGDKWMTSESFESFGQMISSNHWFIQEQNKAVLKIS